jgi:FixJ family two-component response regulator
MSAEIPIVFVVDDDRSVRDSLHRLITSVGMVVEVFPTAQAFLNAPRGDAPACLVLDVRLPGLSGLDLQRELANSSATLPIIFLTGHGDIPMSVHAMKGG